MPFATVLPSGPSGAVRVTAMTVPLRTAREIPTFGSKGDPAETRWRVGCLMLRVPLGTIIENDALFQWKRPRVILALRHPDVVPPASNNRFLIFDTHEMRSNMIEKTITLPEMILWTGTRVALGAGVGMLISRRLSKDAMKAAGLALITVGGFTTIPLAISILSKKGSTRPEIRSVA